MKKFQQILKKSLLFCYLIIVHIFAAFFIFNYYIAPYLNFNEVNIEKVEEPVKEIPPLLPIPSIAPAETPVNTGLETEQNSVSGQFSESSLMIPVVGIKREDLQDTYTAARSENRVHNAIDIIAPGGTPVVAASDGVIAKFFESERGGITIYQFSPDKHFIYYYAHLQKRADNLNENDFVKKGTLIGYVGDTGNSGTGNYHLHFEIMISEDSKSYWKGTDLNPYPLLKEGIEAR